ncbi:MAG TPA: DinB family protein, partial [Cyclobacteriaceae bacterium]|nr:DinB family protein [Cyclobacteriaceae bacterium]
WDKARHELNNFLNSIADRHSRRLIFKHPVAGMLDVRQSVAFMYEHVRHHLPQIKRLLNR